MCGFVEFRSRNLCLVYLCQEKNQIFFQESCYNTVVSFADVSPFVLILFINLGLIVRGLAI